ncbi:MAG: 2'-deoxycytidine 5'-triphosphate deaminase [Solirubrobacteraceae bacterium]
MSVHAVPHGGATPPASGRGGVLPSQRLREAVKDGWITSVYAIPEPSIQPASVDLRLGRKALRLRCSFLPAIGTPVEERAEALTIEEIDIDRGGATLEPGRPYLIPLVEELRLPPHVRAKANPKSSTGRLDVFTRVLTDGNNRFDEVGAGYHGKLYLEVAPRSFAVKVEELLSLNQLRLETAQARVTDEEIPRIHAESPLLYMDSHALPAADLEISDGLFLSVDLSGPHNRVVGYRAKRNSHRLDLSEIRHYEWRDYWEPVYPEKGGRIVLDPELFYLLLSAEGVCVPPGYAAEMMAYDPTAGELRTHYAGFFDPGFGYSAAGQSFGSHAALEVRARDVPFMVEHRQPIAKLAYQRMEQEPDRLYGTQAGSNYQGQQTMLSKHFRDQTAAGGD